MDSTSEGGSRSGSGLGSINLKIPLPPPASNAEQERFLDWTMDPRQLLPVRISTGLDGRSQLSAVETEPPQSLTQSPTALNGGESLICYYGRAYTHHTAGALGIIKCPRTGSVAETTDSNKFWVGSSESFSERIQLEVNEFEAKLKQARSVPRKHLEIWSRSVTLVWKSQYNNYAPLMMRGLPFDDSQSHRYQCYSCAGPLGIGSPMTPKSSPKNAAAVAAVAAGKISTRKKFSSA